MQGVCFMCYMLVSLMLLLGDLKLVEKPQPCILGPYDFTNIKVVPKCIMCHVIDVYNF